MCLHSERVTPSLQNTRSPPTIRLQHRMTNPASIWKKANRSIQSGDFRTAKRLFLKLLKTQPHDPTVLFWAGYCERKMKNFSTALTHLRGALEGDKSNPEISFQMGCLWHDLGNFEAAEKWYRDTVLRVPNWAEAWCSLGDVVEDKREAVGYYQKALQYSPNFAGAAFNMAPALFDEANLTACKEALEFVVRNDANLPRAFFHLAVIHWLSGNARESDTYLQSVLEAKLERLVDSFNYMKANRSSDTRFFGMSFDTLK